jgi:hypothetical protein
VPMGSISCGADDRAEQPRVQTPRLRVRCTINQQHAFMHDHSCLVQQSAGVRPADLADCYLHAENLLPLLDEAHHDLCDDCNLIMVCSRATTSIVQSARRRPSEQN